MPHIIVEHTRDIENVADMLRDLHACLAGQDTFDIDTLKTRSVALNHVVIADGTCTSMVHITVKLLPGRGDALLHKMTSDLRSIALNYVSSLTTKTTVESVELHKESYQK
jgi:5-carboxymethyl-2-hydroxymuconate isomerase